ncbi:MAG: hypothetical protein KA152_18385 [Verrucomicrobiales bacterium]|nr:hypothetical protein [Verrucomicrobiales bacterium]
MELLGVHLFALAAEELRLELFELPFGILAALAFFVEETMTLLDETLALLQCTLEGGDFAVECDCGGSVDA